MIKLLQKLSKVKAKMGAVAKTSDNPYFKSKYADLNSHLEAIEPLLQENGLFLTQPCEIVGGKNVVSTRVYDVETGESISSSLELLVKDVDMQKLGSAVTYARRYTLSAIFGMKAEDDDANVVSGKVTQKQPSSFITKVKTELQPISAVENVTVSHSSPPAKTTMGSFKRPAPAAKVATSGDEL
jgi:hypothetical protein